MTVGTWKTAPPPLAVAAFGVQLAAFARGDGPPPDPDTPEAAAIVDGLEHLYKLAELGEYFWQVWRIEEERGIRAHGVYTAALKPGKAFMAAGEDIAILAPALERWRVAVLNDRRRTPLERIASWELTALACEALGDVRHATAARETARMLASKVSR